MRVFDMELWLPGVIEPGPGKTAMAGQPGTHRLPPPEGYGFPNYATVFTSTYPSGKAADPDDKPLPLNEYVEKSDELIEVMNSCGVVAGVLATAPNDAIGEIAARHPGRILGFPHFSPYDVMRGVRAFEEMLSAGRAHGLHVFSLWDNVPASDRRNYPLYAKCVEFDVPVRIYTAMTLANDRPWDNGHPRHLDQVAVDFPELRIIAGLGGWPWVMETVALVRRHPNLYMDTGSHRPRYLAVAGSGWEPLMRYGNSVLQDKILAALTWTAWGLGMQGVIDEFAALPLKEEVREKWLYSNAASLFRLKTPDA